MTAFQSQVRHDHTHPLTHTHTHSQVNLPHETGHGYYSSHPAGRGAAFLYANVHMPSATRWPAELPR